MDEQPRDPDLELVEQARESPEGDFRAFEQIVDRHQTHVVANCRYLSKSEADAEDLAQEVFLKAFFGLRWFEGRAAFRTWLQRIKVNHCLNYLKKREGKVFVDVEAPAQQQADELQVQPQAERSASARDDRERINAVLDGLSDTLRVPLVLRDMDRLSYQEIAEALGIGLSAVKMRIKRAREEFQRRYGELERASSGAAAAESQA